jgi:hypothetical protein
VYEKHPALHTLKVAPERFCGVQRERIRNEHPHDESEYRCADERIARAVRPVEAGKHGPRDDRDLNQDTEVERLAGNKREEVGIRDQERRKRDKEERAKRYPPRNTLRYPIRHNGAMIPHSLSRTAS